MSTQEFIRKDISPSVSDTHDAIDFHRNIIPSDLCEHAFLSIFPKTREGLLEELRLVSSSVERLELNYLTGLDPDEVIAEPYGYCDTTDNGEGWGTCTRDFYAGRIERWTNTIHLEEAIKRADECDVDAQLLGGLMDAWGRQIFGDLDLQDPLNVVTFAEMIKMVHNIEKVYRSELWIGDRLTSPRITGGGGGASFDGIDVLFTDGIECDNPDNPGALDSIVRDWAGADACGTFVDVDDAVAKNLYQHLEEDMFEISERSSWNQHGDVRGKFWLRSDMWYYLTQCLPCQAVTKSCLGVDPVPSVMFVNDYSRNIYDRFRQQKFLVLNGVEYPVGIDNSIQRTVGVGTKTSNLYYIPTSIMGGSLPVTYLRYIDFRRASKELAYFNRLSGYNMAQVVDSGFGLFKYMNTGTCFKYGFTFRPGLVARTPQYGLKYLNLEYATPVTIPDPYFGQS